MEWDDLFFNQPRLTSKLKHLVLTSYVKRFAYHLGSARPLIYYVDGFAGAGRYGQVEGSPLLVAKFAKQTATLPRPFVLRCLNVESDTERFKSLEEVTEPFRPDVVEKNYREPFADVVKDILDRIGDAPAFFFIDPFGTKGIEFDQLLPIFRRPRGKTTEVLITLHTDGIAKKAGWFGNESNPDPAEQQKARKFILNLAAALNVTVDKLRNAWRQTGEQGNTAAFEDRALNYYLRQLREHFTFAKAFNVRYYDANTLRERPICFHLVFATRHEKGLFEMNDSMVQARDTFYREVYPQTFFPDFAAERERAIGSEAVRQEVEKTFCSSPFTINDVKRHCMQKTDDYLLKGSEYRKLILAMANAGRLRRITKGPVSDDRSQFEFASVG